MEACVKVIPCSEETKSKLRQANDGHMINITTSTSAGTVILVEEPLLRFPSYACATGVQTAPLSNEMMLQTMQVWKLNAHLIRDSPLTDEELERVVTRDYVKATMPLVLSLGLEGDDDMRFFIWMKYLLDASPELPLTQMICVFVDRYRIFKLQSEEVQSKILKSLGHETPDGEESPYLAMVNSVKALLKFLGADVPRDSVSPQAQGWHFEAEIFNRTWRIGHSCVPNARRLDKEDGFVQVRSLRNIEPGEEVTISYCDALASAPIKERRAYLMKKHQFLCECIRCSAPGDDTRRFHCEWFTSSLMCHGYHLVCQPTEESEAKLLKCNECHCEASSQYVASVLAQEKELELYVSKIRLKMQIAPDCEDHPTLLARHYPQFPHMRDEVLAAFRDRFVALRKILHPHHHLAYQFSCMLRGMGCLITINEKFAGTTSKSSAWKRILKSFERDRECIDIVIPYPHAAKGLLHVLQSSLLQSIVTSPEGGVLRGHGICNDLKRACVKSLQRFFRISILTGCGVRDSEYLVQYEFYKELKSRSYPVLYKMQSELGEHCRVNECAVCAGGKEVCVLFRCHRCQRVSYCSKEHQKLAWPTHKLHCFPGLEELVSAAHTAAPLPVAAAASDCCKQ